MTSRDPRREDGMPARGGGVQGDGLTMRWETMNLRRRRGNALLISSISKTIRRECSLPRGGRSCAGQRTATGWMANFTQSQLLQILTTSGSECWAGRRRGRRRDDGFFLWDDCGGVLASPEDIAGRTETGRRRCGSALVQSLRACADTDGSSRHMYS